VIEHKSAVLRKAACEVGAISGRVTRAERRKLAEFGREVGLAFQLRDDALDYEATEVDLGKRPQDDLREGKITLPLLLALKRCRPAEREAIGGLLKSAARLAIGEDLTPDAELDLEPALSAVRRYRGVEDTVRRAGEHARRAADALAPFPDCRAKRDLLAAAEFAVNRDR
jgi:octaprenyl-diphosphate synthase